MSLLIRSRRLITAGAIALLAACSNGMQSPGGSVPANLAPASANRGARAVSMVSVPSAWHADDGATHETSWMAKGAAKASSLLYVTSQLHGTVAVWQYKNATQLVIFGKLIGFKKPTQPCVDTAGNVYIPDATLSTITKYAHGGVKPLLTLADPNGSPSSCSVNKTNGDLAVANFGSGNVTIWPGGSGNPVEIQYATSPFTEFLAYDNAGNLLLNSNDGSGHGILAYLPAGSSSLTDLTQSGFTLGFPGSVQWGGTNWLVGDQGQVTAGCPCHVNPIAVSGSTATMAGAQLTFGGTPTDIVAFWKRGAPNYAHISAADNGASNVPLYTYPGMQPVGLLTHRVKLPFGTVVSQMPSN